MGDYYRQEHGRRSDGNYHHHHQSHRQERSRRLVMRERIFSITRNDFDITEGHTRNIAFTVRGDSTSVHDSRTLRDGRGRAVYRMKVILVSAHGRMVIKHCGSGEPVVTLRRKSLVPFSVMGGGTVRVWRGSRDSGQPWLEINGEHEGDDFVIEDAVWGDEIATIHRKSMTFTNIIFRRCTYVLKVRPGCNAALMVFLVTAIHDYFRE